MTKALQCTAKYYGSQRPHAHEVGAIEEGLHVAKILMILYYLCEAVFHK